MRRVLRLSLPLVLLAVPVAASGGGEDSGAAPHAAAQARLEDYFSQQEIARADRYRGPHYAYAFGSLTVTMVVLGLLPFWSRARALTGRAPGRWWLHALLASAVVTIAPAVATLALDIARHEHDRSYGLATNSLGAFLSDGAKATAFQFVVTAVVATGFVGVARALPRGWPFAAAAGGAALTVFLVFVLPLVYEPLFNRFTPVDEATRARVLAIARTAGVEVRDVLVADASRRTTKQNAYVSGIGATKRVVLYDTLLNKSSPREVDLVVAHELAHEKHGDVPRGTAYGVAGVIAGVIVLWLLLRWQPLRAAIGVSGAGDSRVVPFLALFIAAAGLLTLPLANWISRGAEGRADRTAIELTGDPEGAIQLEVNLARDNISDLRPNGFIRWAFFSHPPTLERIQVALDHRAARR